MYTTEEVEEVAVLQAEAVAQRLIKMKQTKIEKTHREEYVYIFNLCI